MNILLNTFKILKKQDRVKLLFLFFLIFLNTILEMIGIGIIFPILGLVVSEKFLSDYFHYLNFFSPILEINKKNLIFIFSIFLVIIFLIKNFIGLYFSYYKYKFTYSLFNYFSEKLFLKYINKDILYFAENNSSVAIRNIENVGIFTEGINQFLFIVIEVVFIIFLMIFLFSINFLNTFFLSIVGFVLFILFRVFTKKKLITMGEQRHLYLQKKIKTVYESINGIREIKIFSKEGFFLKKYQDILEKYSDATRIFETYQALPKLMLEVSVIIILVTILFLNSFYSNYETDIVIPTLAVFGISAIKLLPSTNRIISSIQFFNHFNPVISTTVNELKNFQENYSHDFSLLKNNEILFDKYIKIENLSFSYGNKEILKDLNLIIKKNDVIGIVGRTGSGKSTLVNLLVGILSPSKGKIIIDDNLEIKDLSRMKNNLFGYIPQSTFLLDDTIKNNITFGQDPIEFDNSLFWHCLKLSRIDDFVNSLNERENSIVGEKGIKISGGQAQRLSIARALYKEPQILILDEATSSLDLQTEQDFVNAIKEVKNKFTIIIVTHRIKSLDICDRILSLENGTLKPFENN